MTDTITISAGRPNRQGDEQDFTGPDGTYTATLSAVSEPVTEKSTLADAKGDGTWTYRDWTFAIDDESEFNGQVIDVRANAGSSGPKSKQYGIIAALVGRTPPVGAQLDIQKHLVGRQCLVSIATDEDNGYPKIQTFMALPPSRQQAPAAAPAPEPEPAPLREQVAAAPDSLPF